MKRLFRALFTAGSSRAVPPLVIGFFFLFYIGVAFFTDETLITLMAFTRNSFVLALILALIPLNSVFRLVGETSRFMLMRSTMSGKNKEGLVDIFDEVVEIPVSATVPNLENRLAAVGYKTCRTGNVLAAWRGINSFPVRLFFLVGTFCIFTGILITTTSRSSLREMVVEGEPLPTPDGSGGIVERITLANSSGLILSRNLTMKVTPAVPGSKSREFGLYPPSRYGGAFVYPRYLGLALYLRFTAPDMPAGADTHCFLNVYPPGKEDNVVIPGSPYRVIFSIPEPETGSDRYISYMSDTITFGFKLLKGNDVLFSGSVPGGGEFVRDGFRLALPDVRRLVVTDLIYDNGVLFIWWSALLFCVAAALWLPIRVFSPRREMLFRFDHGVMTACSLAEGRSRKHAGVFHEMLDMIDAGKAGEE
ncbi:MAG: hypothetical protein PHR66_05060 [Desulfuromonadaceae bacterium]|nr:hypothetical protein [Desulfuromonadaceae bacterium]